MSENPIVIIVFAAIAAYVLKLWIDDFRALQRGEPNPRALPGAAPAPVWLIALAAAVSLGLVGLETIGEAALGISEEQSTITALYLLAMISAGIVEELIFRGYLVITRGGRGALIASIIGFSVIFALIHGHLLGDREDGLLKLDTAGLWWTFILFLNSLWWYAVRFMPANTHRSLLPCFAGHVASNIGVFIVKFSQGYVTF